MTSVVSSVTSSQLRIYRFRRKMARYVWLLAAMLLLSTFFYALSTYVFFGTTKSAIVGDNRIVGWIYKGIMLDLQSDSIVSSGSVPFTTDVHEAKIHVTRKDKATLYNAIIDDAIEHGAHVSKNQYWKHKVLFVADSEYRKRIEPLTHLTKRDIRRSDNSMDLYYGSWVRDPSSRPDIGMSGKNTVYHINVKSNMIERASTSRTLLALNCTVFVLLGGSMLNGARITQFIEDNTAEEGR